MKTDEEKMVAFEAKLCSHDGVSVWYQKNTKRPKKGSLRLDDEDVFILKRLSSKGFSKESRIRWKDVAGVFGSTHKDTLAATVLIGATRHVGDRHVRIDSWRFTINEANVPPRDAIMVFIRSKGDVANGVLTNVFPTHASNMACETVTFTESILDSEGLGSLRNGIPEILGVCEQMFKIGESVAVVAPVFTLFAAIVSNYETVQGLKSDFIDLLSRWSGIEGNLVGEDKLRRDLLALAEDFFFKPGWSRRLASKDFQSDLTRLAERMDRAAHSRLLGNTATIKEKVEGINTNVNELLRERQGSLAQEKPFDWKNVKSILPQKRKLMGRHEELATIGAELEVRGAIVALTGVGGCGKSHLGLEVAFRWTQRKTSQSLRVAFFVSAENETSCRSSLLRVMKMLGLEPVLQENGSPVPTVELFRCIFKRLEEAPLGFQVLWFLDNVPVADGLDMLSQWFGPAGSRDCNRFYYLLTSQSTVYGGKTTFGDIEKIEVDPLPTDVCVDLLTKNFAKLRGQEDEMLAANELVEKHLHNLPVAILAVAGMINHPLTFRGYLKKLREKKVTAGVDSVAEVLQDALSHARKDVGMARILDVAAFISPDNIPLALLGDEELVGRLCELNLLQVVSHELYSMHRLIQEAARVGRSATHAIGALDSIMDLYDSDNPATWATGVAILPHVDWLRRVAHVTYVSSNLFPREVMRIYGRLMNKCGFVYGTVLCDFLSRRQLQEDALKVFRALYGETAFQLNIAETLSNLGVTYTGLGKYGQAKNFFTEALTMYRAVFGETANHSEIAMALKNLGAVSQSLGDYKQSKEYSNQALTMYRAVYGETAVHSEIAMTLNNLGIVDRVLGDYEQAKGFFEQALTMKRAVYGEMTNHSNIARTLHSLGAVNSDLGNYEQARDRYNQALVMRRAVYGETTNHSEIARTLGSLGQVYGALRDDKLAKDCYNQALAMYRAVFGETSNHSDIASTLNSLGNVYRKLKDYKQAKDFYSKALTMCRAVYGETTNHLDIAAILGNLGIVYRALGDYEQADAFYTQAKTMYQAVFGAKANHSEIARTLGHLGNVYRKRGDYEQAKDFYSKALAMYRAVYRGHDHHPDIQWTLRLLKRLAKYNKSV